MNSRWNENLIIFAMALVSTHSVSRIKIRAFGSTRDQLRIKLGKSCQKSPKSSSLMKNHENCCFLRILTLFDIQSTVGWLEAFWSFELKRALWALRCLNRLCHITLDVLTTPWRENNIFEFFKVQHANQGWTKYDINNEDLFLKSHTQEVTYSDADWLRKNKIF